MNVLITGGSGDIGKAIAEAFCEKGHNVIVQYNCTKPNFENTYRADFTKPEEITAMCEQIIKDFGKIDILVNNAGVGVQNSLLDITYDAWRTTFAINVDAAFLVTKAFLPGMLRQNFGKIINISSMWGVTGASCEVDYSASKAAIIGFTKALAKEVGPSGINVNCIAPGLIDTKMNRHLSEEEIHDLVNETPVGRIGTPYDIARAVLYLASNEASFITGEVLNINGGMVI